MTTEPIALVAGTAAGRRHAAALAATWPSAEVVDEGSVADSLRAAWRGGRPVVAFVATGIVVRVLGPLLGDKHADPAVVVVDDAARHAIALLGGHARGGNVVAERVSAALGAAAVLTTATDVRGLPGLDTLGLPVEGAVAAVTRAMLDGVPVRLEADVAWPLPALPPCVAPDAAPDDAAPDDAAPDDAAPDPEPDAYRLLVTDRAVDLDERTAVLRPPTLVAGVGASRGVSADEVAGLLKRALADAGLSPRSLRCLATADVKADEAGIVEVARRLGLPLMTYPASVLAEVDVPNPSTVVADAVGTPSVAEASALLPPTPSPSRAPSPSPSRDHARDHTTVDERLPGYPRTCGGLHDHGGAAGAAGARGTAGELVVPKRASAMATVAIARHAPRGRLAIVGLGPGARDLLTPRAVDELRRASVVVGLDQYVEQVRDLLRPGTRVIASGLGQEEERARAAVDEARAGRAVALVGSGDAGVYAMASPALEEADTTIDVVGVPGVTAGLAASALLGAPLGHDHAYLSLSDLHTPWPVIEARVRAAAEGDLVVLFYNPRSRARDWQLGAALAELAVHRPPDTPVGVVRNASRPDETVLLTTMKEFDPAVVDMYSLVVVGSSQSRIVAGRMVTPRGHRWREEAGR